MVMSPYRQALIEIRELSILRTGDEHVNGLRLQRRGDRCSLVDPSGVSVFSAQGRDARRRCLEFAREHGVLALAS